MIVKRIYHIGCSVMALLLSSFMLIASPSFVMAAPEGVKAVGLRVTEVEKEGAGLAITFEIKNRGADDIWVYVGNNGKGLLPYVSRIVKKEKKLFMGFESVAAKKDTPPEETLAYRYKRIAPGRTIMFKVDTDAEVSDYSPVTGKGEGNLKASEIGVVELEVGYYEIALDEDDSCCMPATRASELYVIPAWSLSHPEKKISVVVSKRRRWK